MKDDSLKERLIRVETKLDLLVDIKMTLNDIKKSINEHYRDIDGLKKDVDFLKVEVDEVRKETKENTQFRWKRDAGLVGAATALMTFIQFLMNNLR